MNGVCDMGNLGDLQQYFGEMPQFWRICRKAWDSGEDMAADLMAFAGINVSPNTCRNYMTGQTEPNATRTFAILAIVDAKLEQEIIERRERRDKLRRIYAR